jgi:selenocysteine-specific elongation factor
MASIRRVDGAILLRFDDMKSIVIGTAGHIDHGKTALVKALTGIDADRLDEEKRRGITIDLGFAHMDLQTPMGETLQLGFIDVPGHERFIRNMLAGVGGIDLVLLVIAADESIMPQTREHFEILQLLGVQRGITVLTKSDAVDAETLDVIRLEVEQYLRGTFLEPPLSPVIAVSALTGAGLGELKAAIVSAAEQALPRNSGALPRLPIDRVFTMKGFGTVVTGTLSAGTVRRDDELEVFPVGARVRVRGVQVHGCAADQALAGQRTALNLVGASTEDLARGMTLVPPGMFSATRRADVRLTLLASAPRALKNRCRVHFHSNTMEAVVEAAFHESRSLSPGSEVFARLKFPEAVFLLPEDRFILRQLSPALTIGGGVVLDAAPLSRPTELKSFLRSLQNGDSGQRLEARIARRGQGGISISGLVAETGWTQVSIENALAPAIEGKRVLIIGDRAVHGPAILALKELVIFLVGAFHKKNSLAHGITKEELREQAKASAEVLDFVLGALAKEREIETSEDIIRLRGHGVVLKDEESESKNRIESAFSAAGLNVPVLNVVIAGLKIDKLRAQKIVTLLLREKTLIKVSEDLFFHRSALNKLRELVAAAKMKSLKIDVGKFKEMTGVSRKYAIPLLEYLDRERVTKRVGDVREIL